MNGDNISFGPGGRGDCGVVALAVVMGSTYDRAWEYLKWAGKYGDDWTGGTRDKDIELAVWRFGYRANYIFLRPPAEPHKDWEVGEASVMGWIKTRADPAAKYLVHIKGHVLAVIDGMCVDNATREKCDVGIYLDALCGVKAVREIVVDPFQEDGFRHGPDVDRLGRYPITAKKGLS